MDKRKQFLGLTLAETTDDAATFSRADIHDLQNLAATIQLLPSTHPNAHLPQSLCTLISASIFEATKGMHAHNQAAAEAALQGELLDSNEIPF